VRENVEQRIERVIEEYVEHLNPGLASLLKFLGFDTVESQAEGVFVWDVRGEKYLDCLGGFGVFTLGHRHPRVVAAVQAQLARQPMSSRVLFNEVQAELAALLAEVTPGNLQYSFFCNSGAEAVEGALKLARLYTGKPGLVAAEGAFHGKTLGALSVSGREKYKEPFRPLLPGVKHVPFGEVEALAQAIDEETGAVILEPIQGEAGVIIPPEDYWPQVRELCDAHGVLLIADEVQTGLGRTGKMFGVEHSGAVPDIMTLAKALGGGVMPLAAFSATAQVWEAMTPNPLLHSSTWGGNPLACAAGLAALRTTLEEDLPRRAAILGEMFLTRLRALQERYPEVVTEVRGRGLMIGIEFREEDLAGLTIAGLAQRRVLAAYTLNNPTVIRLQPPLIITEAQADQALTAFEEAVAQAVELVRELD